jgi:hypothetical protein
MLKLALATVVLAHGVGHILFLGPAVRLVDWAGQTGRSWLLTTPLGDTATRGVAGVVWAGTMALFVAGVAGFATDQTWWRPVTTAAALVSLAGIVLFWDGIATTSAGLALVFDLAILAALLLVHWPSSELVGS